MSAAQRNGGNGTRNGQPIQHVKFRPGARAVGSYIPKLTRKVFEKYGFSTADLLTDWATIVGQEMAAYTSPQRLKWPRQNAAGPDSETAGQRGATLVLRVDGGRALDVQYQARQIIERINGYFGYRAIHELRFIQAPLDLPARTGPKPLPREVISRHKQDIPEIKDEGLRTALERLGASLLAEKATRSTG